jgi:hypothetical protein
VSHEGIIEHRLKQRTEISSNLSAEATAISQQLMNMASPSDGHSVLGVVDGN